MNVDKLTLNRKFWFDFKWVIFSFVSTHAHSTPPGKYWYGRNLTKLVFMEGFLRGNSKQFSKYMKSSSNSFCRGFFRPNLSGIQQNFFLTFVVLVNVSKSGLSLALLSPNSELVFCINQLSFHQNPIQKHLGWVICRVFHNECKKVYWYCTDQQMSFSL